MELRLLGPPAVLVDGRPLQVDTRKAVALLAYLAAAESPPGRDQLAALLWPEADADRARNALRRTLSALRTGLGERWVGADRSRVTFDATGVVVDIQEAARAASTTHDHLPGQACPECIAPLEVAAALHRGEFMDGFSLRDAPEFDSWQREVASEQRRRRRRILDRLAMAYAASGRYDEAAEVARRRLATDPLDEGAHRQLMLALAWSGDRPGAIEAYRSCVRVLEAELGVPPLEETTELYEAIVEEDLPRFPGAIRSAHSLVERPHRPPMIGRVEELARLHRLLVTGGAVVLTGEAGIGKTRLQEEVVGEPRLQAKAHRAERHLPYGVITQLLAAGLATPAAAKFAGAPDWMLIESIRLLPEFALLRPGLAHLTALDHPAAEHRLIDAVTRLLGMAGGMCVIDDAQWVDPPSATVLVAMLRRVPEHRQLLCLALRRDEVPADSPLSAALSEPVEGLETIDLGPLSPEEAVQVAREATGRSEPMEMLMARTGGVPLYLVNDLEGEGGVRVRAAIGARIEGLTELARQILTAAAVGDGLISVDWLRRVSGRSEDETVTGVEDLLSHRMLRELGGGELGGGEPDGGELEITHEALRLVAYETASLSRRRLLHRRAGEAAAAIDDLRSAVAATRHLRMAGRDAEAARFAARAGDLSAAVFAVAEATDHYQTALALGHRRPGPIRRSLGDLAQGRGRFGEARRQYQAAAALMTGGELAEVEHRIGEVDRRVGAFDQAERHFRRAEPEHPDPTALYADWALLEYRRGRGAEARRLAERALLVAQGAGDEARALDILGVLADHPGEAIGFLERSLERADEDPRLKLAALNNLSLAVERAGDHQRAQTLAEEGLTLARRVADRHREAAMLNRLADLRYAEGDLAGLRQFQTEAMRLFAEVGSEPGMWEPEVWLLRQW